MEPNSKDDTIPFDLLMKVGFPTFDEFRKNPDKYRKGVDELFTSVDASTQVKEKRKVLNRQRHMWRDKFMCDSLEQLQRIAKEEGFDCNDLEMLPMMRHLDGTSEGGRIEIIIQYWPKHEFAMMGKVATNSD